jgi:hypothetical protein
VVCNKCDSVGLCDHFHFYARFEPGPKEVYPWNREDEAIALKELNLVGIKDVVLLDGEAHVSVQGDISLKILKPCYSIGFGTNMGWIAERIKACRRSWAALLLLLLYRCGCRRDLCSGGQRHLPDALCRAQRP